MEHTQKLEYLISLFFNTDRLIKERSQTEGLDPLSLLRFEALRFIGEGEPTMRQIADRLRIKAPSATSFVEALNKAGYVARKKDPTDRRIVRMHITARGKQSLKDSSRRILAKTKEILSHLKQKQIDDFIAIMEEIEAAYK
ncbi:MAG TPA: MarR family transcriptional regulator [Candidatus Paceibacterota bacterium]|jgi:DNA-binding MarR family transcriptional regulator|nr:MarR family transcriptional regulator [Candidatus Paceibacterota bacterium]